MNLLKLVFILLGAVVLLEACASKQTVTKTQVRRNIWESGPETFSVGKDKDGNPVMQSELRSHFEGKRSTTGSTSDYSGKDYTAQSYAKKRWGGDSSLERKKYQGNTDANHYKMEPLFVRKQASAKGQRANAEGKAYASKSYEKSTAREQDGSRVKRTSDAETDVRRRVFKEPDIINWKEQSGLSVQDTNRMLGR